MKKQLLFLVLMMLPLVASADAVEIDGIYYKFKYNNTAEVTSNPHGKYTGSVIIPESVTYEGTDCIVTSIGRSAFYGCSGLTSITIGNGVTSINESAFCGCTSLTTITIPNSVTSIAALSFQSCPGLTSIIVEEGNSRYDSRNNCNGIIVTATNTLIVGCQNTLIPNSVTTIDGNAFVGCTSLTSVTIPNSVTSIGQSLFVGCTGLTSIIVEEGNSRYDSRNNCNAIIETATNTLFAGCQNTTIPNSVTSIGQYAFRGCTGLTSVTIPNSVTSIGDSAFNGCYNLESVTIPNSVTTIGEQAFDSCSKLASVTIGNSVTSIKIWTFYGCESLTSVTIPNSVTSIDACAFYKCSGLSSVTIGNGVTSIGSYAFRECSRLTSITIPNSITSIGFGAFQGCSGLHSVTIGNGVTSIGGNAFDGADISTVISLIENPFEIYGKTPSDYATFSLNTFNNATLYVPSGTIDKYKTTNGWKEFENIAEGNPAGINVVENTKSHNTTIYDLNGVRLSEPKKGINIVNGKKIVVK